MLPSRPVAGGPFTRSIREALEAAVSPTAAQNVLADALKRASLASVPEEIEPFRRFCEGAFRTSVRAAMGDESVEQVFERLGHVLWMATSDVSALQTARAWSRGTGETPRPDRDDDSGVRHVESIPRRSPPPLAPHASKDDESGPGLRRPTVPAPPALETQPLSSTAIGRMRAPTLTTRAATGSRPGGSATEVRTSLAKDPRAASSPPTRPMTPSTGSAPPARFTPLPPRLGSSPTGPLPPMPTPVRASSSPPGRAPSSPPRNAPTAVLVLTLDTNLVSDIRTDLHGQCPVRTIGTPAELAASVAMAGQRPVIVVDTALPSIDVPTFAGLAPILPAGARVVLWGAAPRQQQRLATMFPHATTWVASGSAPRAGAFLLELP